MELKLPLFATLLSSDVAEGSDASRQLSQQNVIATTIRHRPVELADILLACVTLTHGCTGRALTPRRMSAVDVDGRYAFVKRFPKRRLAS